MKSFQNKTCLIFILPMTLLLLTSCNSDMNLLGGGFETSNSDTSSLENSSELTRANPLSISAIVIKDSVTGEILNSISNNSIFDLEGKQVDIEVQTNSKVSSVSIELLGALSKSSVDNSAPFTLNNISLIAGDYNLNVKAYSKTRTRGRSKGPLSYNFSVAGSNPDPEPEPDPVPPTANYSYSCTDLACNFADSSTDDEQITSYHWTFGDGNSSTAKNPSHNYGSAGNYSVKLTVTDNDNLKSSKTKIVSVTEPLPPEPEPVPPTANYNYTCTDLACNFADSSTDDEQITSYNWTFGDGNSSTATNPSHNFGATGNYSVKLTVTDNDGLTSSKTKIVSVTEPPPPDPVPPIANFNYSCTDLACSFTNTSTDDEQITSYNWTFGDGNSSTVNNPSYSFSAAGSYSVKLTVTDNDNLNSSKTRIVSVTEPSPPPTNGCPINYVKVPPLAGYTFDEFCVAKYEMKNDGSDKAVSKAVGGPYANIRLDHAMLKCQELGEEFDLITNDQWQSIARNIELVGDNWSGGNIGSAGGISTGYSDVPTENFLIYKPMAASTDDNDGCFNTLQTCNGNTWAPHRRTHTLSNGEVIWDISGNVDEWVKDEIISQYGIFGESTYISQITNSSHTGMASLSGGTTTTLRNAKGHFGPAGNYSHLNTLPFGGLGYGVVYYSWGVLSRGGDFRKPSGSLGSESGVFRTSMFINGYSGVPQRGFRCVKNL